MSKISSVFSSSSIHMKPMRLKKGNNVILKGTKDIAYLPIVESVKDLASNITTIFGKKLLTRFFKKYYIPRKAIFTTSIGPKISPIKIDNLKSEIDTINHYLTEYSSSITMKLVSSLNTVIDMSSIFSKVIPEKNKKDVWNKLLQLKFSDKLYLDIISGIIFNLEISEYLKNLKIKDYTPISNKFKTIVISIPVTSKRLDMATRYLHPDAKLPRSILLNKEDLKIVSIIRFLLKYYGQDLEQDSYFSHIKTLFDNSRIVFIFNNKIHYFFIDTTLARSEKIPYKTFYANIVKCMKLLLSSNNEPGLYDEVDNVLEIEEPKNNSERVYKIIANSNKKAAIDTKTNKKDDLSSNVDISGREKNPMFVDQEPDKESEIIEQEDELEEETNQDSEIEDESEIEKKIKEEKDKEEDIGLSMDTIEKELLLKIDSEIKPKRSPKQLARIELCKNKYKSITTPEGKNVEELLNDIETKEIEHEVSDIDTKDSSVRGCSIIDFEKSYYTKVFEKDIITMVRSFSNNKTVNMYLTDYSREDTSDQFTYKYTYKFNLEDENQKRHTIKVNIPKIDEDGFLFLNGNKIIIKYQQIFLPIVKTGINRVFITSNYNKCIIERQGTILNRKTLVLNTLINKYSKSFTNFSYSQGNNINENRKYLTTIEYDELSKKYDSIIIGSKTKHNIYYFNQLRLRQKIKELKIPYKKDNNKLPIGINSIGEIIFVEIKKSLPVSVCDYIISDMINYKVHADISNIIAGINTPKRRMYSVILYQSKRVPLISFLGCLFGLTKIINTLGAKIELSDKKIKNDLRLYIRFKDVYIYYDEYPMDISSLLNGLADLKTQDYNLEEFDTVVPYTDRFYERFKTRHVLKGFVDAKDLFLDGITLEILNDLSLPTNFLEVFLYANELLSDNEHEPESHMSHYRFRKHEMIAVYLYEALAKQYSIIRKKTALSDNMSIHIDEVIKLLQLSTISENYDDINPVNELKSKGVVTFKGPMGIKGDRDVPVLKRLYSPSARGVLGIPSTDSSNVGIIKQMSLDSNIVSTRGYIKQCESDEEAKSLSFAKVSSPEEAILPFTGRHDDPKRTGFASIQTKHIHPVNGASPGLVGTGFDKVLSDKVSDSYVKKAKKKGKIIKINEKESFGVIEYNDGTKEEFQFGNVLSRNSNCFMENHLELNVIEGQTVSKGYPLSYNKDFFRKDAGGQLLYCQGAIARIALLDAEYTSEDSSLITSKFSERLSATTVYRNQIVLSKNANIISKRNIGDKVLLGDPLITFEDDTNENEINEITNILGDVDEKVLDNLVRQKAKSSKTGTIVDIKIYWTIPTQEMSESCNKAVSDYKSRIRKKIKEEKEITGAINKQLSMMLEVSNVNRNRINGAIVPEDGGLVFEYFISSKKNAGVGDKISFYSSLKSVIATVVPEGLEPYTENGEQIDAILGALSSNARQVTSMDIAGSLGKILQDYGKTVATEFLKK